MAFLDNLKISSKIVALLLMLGGITLFIAWNGSQRLTDTSGSYGKLVDVTLPNNTNYVRVNRSLTAMVYASYQALVYDGATLQARSAAEQEAASYDKAVSRLQEIVTLEPTAAGDVAALRKGIDRIHALTGEAVKFGLQNRDDEARSLLTKGMRRQAG